MLYFPALTVIEFLSSKFMLTNPLSLSCVSVGPRFISLYHQFSHLSVLKFIIVHKSDQGLSLQFSHHPPPPPPPSLWRNWVEWRGRGREQTLERPIFVDYNFKIIAFFLVGGGHINKFSNKEKGKGGIQENCIKNYYNFYHCWMVDLRFGVSSGKL